MQNLIIDKELRELIPSPTEEERNVLEENLKREGCRESIKVWGNIIVDGHNRYDLCQKNNIDFKTEQIDFESMDDAKIWMIQNQLGRRNLPKYAAIILAEKEAEIKNNRQVDINDINQEEVLPIKKKKAPREKIAKIANVGERTVNRVRQIEEKLNEAEAAGKTIQGEDASKIRNELMTGNRSINDVFQAVQKPHIANNSGNNEWYTPSEYIEAAREVMGNIDLDPASSEIANNVVKADMYYTIEDDGLAKEWIGKIWLNPPYSADLIGKFVDKAVESDFEQMIVLVNNATDTQWFLKLIGKAKAIVFTTGRVKFYKPDNSSGTPLQGQALIYIGENKDKFLDVFSKFGWGVEIAH